MSARRERTPGAGRTMLVVSARPWDGMQARPHHFARLAARSGWSVLYLEPPASLAAPLRRPSRALRWGRWLQGPRAAEPGVTRVAPPPVLPLGSRRRAPNAWNQRWIGRTLRAALTGVDAERLDLYTYLPTSVDLLPRVPHARAVYDCVDEHRAFPGLVDGELVDAMERELMARADLSLASARALYERRRAWSARLHLVQNGCEYERFAAPPGELLAMLPRELESGRPIVGFVGGIGPWVDLELVAGLARRRPGLELALVGEPLVDLRALRGLANVHVLGLRPYAELPAWLARFAACILPFRVNELTAAVDPIKLYEALAAGKAVVSTPLPEVLAHRAVVRVADGVDAFAAALDAALEAAGDAEEVGARRAVARGRSWQAQWDRVLDALEAERGA